MVTLPCRGCGKLLNAEDKFCPVCGKSTSELTGSTTSPSASEQKEPSNYGSPPHGVPQPNPYLLYEPYGSPLQAPPPPSVDARYAAPPLADQQAVGARTRPAGVTLLTVLVALQGIDYLLSSLIGLAGGNVVGFVVVGTLGGATIWLARGLWTLRRWAFVTAIVLEIIYLLFALLNLAQSTVLVTIIERVIIEVVIPLVVLICLFAIRNVRAAIRGK